MLRRICPLLVSFALVLSAQSSKRPLRHTDYDSWKAISGQVLSRDGKYLVYSLFPQDGDGEIVIRDVQSGREVRKAVGSLPPPPETSEENSEAGPPPPRGVRLLLTSDSKYAIATSYASKKETDEAKKARKPSDQMPKAGVIVVELETGKETRVADVSSFQVPENGGAWVALLKFAKNAPAVAPPAVEAAKPADGDSEDQRRGGAAGGAGGADAARNEFGAELVLRNLASGSDRVFEDVTEVVFAKDGKALVYAVGSKKEESNGVYVAVPGSAAAALLLSGGKGKYTRPVWDRLERQMVFLSNRGADTKKFRAFWWDRKAAQATEIGSDGTLMPGFVLAERGAVSFSWDGGRIYLPLVTEAAAAARGAAAGMAAAVPVEDQAQADLWRWNDDLVQPMQKVRAGQDRSRTYRGVYHIAEKKLIQLADPSLTTVNPSDDGRWAIGNDDRKYRAMVDYDGNYSDLVLVDTLTGQRTPLLQKFRGGATWSPKGDAVLMFRKGDWLRVKLPDGSMTSLTASLPVKFANEQYDSPGEAGSYGSAGWLKDGSGVLVYDMYDVWLLSADGKTQRRLTKGREEKLQFRVTRPDGREGAGGDDEEERGIDPAKPIWLRAEHTETRESGIYKLGNLQPDSEAVRLLWGPKSYRMAAKARDAEVFVVSAQTFAEEPNLHVTDGTFKTLKQVTNANPQKAGLLWGSGELMGFRSADGVPLQAGLYKPENFDPTKKYPVIVYIYERLSQNVHTFAPPRPGHNLNFPYYVSNGYLILTPDIVYTIGSPGQSALKCVMPAIEELVKRGFVDEKRIGIAGHSWGGYQIAYMLTRTSRFRAAESGAPVGNMTSAYNGIRWGTGLPRQFQYEKTQSRIGATLWEDPLDYIENSPVFRANKVTTPVLILANDADDAVPWYQGIELFLSLRRNGKEAYLFNYNGEKHHLLKRPNQKDYAVRMQQFFDYFLKDAQKPDWMEKGVPYLDREEEKKRFFTTIYGEGTGVSTGAGSGVQ
ncbi:MAG: prolyl oligopeptidase family serine peptidase [Bryobacteraceae bacterium]|nr:prolyl oligopeptidase family serine peptidase [Bryobacteraceae bacterium]